MKKTPHALTRLFTLLLASLTILSISVAAAGTEIVLRNNGRIDINGLLFINGMPYLGMGG